MLKSFGKSKKEVVPAAPVTPDETSELTQLVSNVSNSPKELSTAQKLAIQYANTKKERSKFKSMYSEEKRTTKKLYKSLVNLASELRTLKIERSSLEKVASTKIWYDGDILPGITEDVDLNKSKREPTSPTELFFDTVIVMAFLSLGRTTITRNAENNNWWPTVAYFAVVWRIWCKGEGYATRFDTSDFFSQLVTLLSSLAVLLGISVVSAGTSVEDGFNSHDATGVMKTAASVSMLNLLLHLRVAYFHNVLFVSSDSDEADIGDNLIKWYVQLQMGLTFTETLVWVIGITAVPQESDLRWIVFLVGIMCSLRIPRAFLGNDFYAAASKRGFLFILLLGFLLQGVVLAAVPFFNSQPPSSSQCIFIGLSCFLFYCLKLLYIDDTYTITPQDHALLVSPFSGFCFQIGQFCILVSTTIFGTGLHCLTTSFFNTSSAFSSLSNNAQTLLTGGFAALVASICITKSMHIRRMPVNSAESFLFFAASVIQIVISFIIVVSIARASFALTNGTKVMMLLSGATTSLVILSWLDRVLDAMLYGSTNAANKQRVHAFGIFSCLLEALGKNSIGENKYETLIKAQSASVRGSMSPKKVETQSLLNTSATGNSVKFASNFQSFPIESREQV